MIDHLPFQWSSMRDQFDIIAMGGEICTGTQRQQPLAEIQQQQAQVSLSLKVASKEQQSKRMLRERVEVAAFPMLNKHIEERIRKLSNFPTNNNKIWKVRHPYNIIYANTDPVLSNQSPNGCVQVYKLRENGDFQGYFEGTLNQKLEPELKGAIFVYPNASYFLGATDTQGTYSNQVTSLTYTGGWSNEQPEGEGVEKNNKGKYMGQYRRGEKEGKGLFQWSDGSSYQGAFVRGLFHGKGKIVDTTNKYSYEGQFRAGEKHGQGVEHFQLESYDGQFHRGKRSGKGVLTIYSPDRTVNLVYEGTFCNGMPNGSGKATRQSKKIQGLWQQGRLFAIQQ